MAEYTVLDSIDQYIIIIQPTDLEALLDLGEGVEGGLVSWELKEDAMEFRWDPAGGEFCGETKVDADKGFCCDLGGDGCKFLFRFRTGSFEDGESSVDFFRLSPISSENQLDQTNYDCR